LTSRIALHTRGIAEPAAPEDPNAVELVGCGQPIADHEIRIVDDMGRELGERREGGLEFRGPSATSGYFQNPAKTRDLFHAGWLDTGDRAYIAGGNLFVTGRIKDSVRRATGADGSASTSRRRFSGTSTSSAIPRATATPTSASCNGVKEAPTGRLDSIVSFSPGTPSRGANKIKELW
jgi:acyl-CoA synthetase (AMP-forming)/AMP-acid ligase II